MFSIIDQIFIHSFFSKISAGLGNHIINQDDYIPSFKDNMIEFFWRMPEFAKGILQKTPRQAYDKS